MGLFTSDPVPTEAYGQLSTVSPPLGLDRGFCVNREMVLTVKVYHID